jgi:hypothetical protein
MRKLLSLRKLNNKIMKVLNKEVTTCLHCPCSHPFIHEEYTCRCNLTTKLIDTTKGIDEECPFLQPLTKEVIEGFGFEEFAKDCFRKGSLEITLYSFGVGIDNGYSETTYYVTSKIELEFILRSIGVVEDGK